MLSMREFKGKDKMVQKITMSAQMMAMQQAMMAQTVPAAGPAGGGEVQPSQTQEDATEAGKRAEDPATSPAIERMRTSLDEAITP